MVNLDQEQILKRKLTRLITDGPYSSYSALVIHCDWNVDREARIEPPIHTLSILSCGAITFTLWLDGISLRNSFSSLSGRPVIEVMKR